MLSLAQRVRSPSTLRHAWGVIFDNARHSASPVTRSEVGKFALDADKNLNRILRELRSGAFRFLPAKGVLKTKKGGAKRPLVISPIPNRIVQRALLDVIQSLPTIKAKLQARHNFGGVEELGVPEAIKEAYSIARNGGHFIRTDIREFFVKIPRGIALKKITSLTDDAEFNELLRRATETELENISALKRDRELFPLEGIGVAQGSCLSPLLANLLLDDLDKAMNDRGIRCIRYIDDFILFAESQAKATAALKGATKMLDALYLKCYDPKDRPDKAEIGRCVDGFTFLGCEIRPGRIRPSRKSQRALREKLKKTFDGVLAASKDLVAAAKSGQTYLDGLSQASRIIRGWGNTYFFCTDDSLWATIDVDVSRFITSFDRRYRAICLRSENNDLRKMLGVYRLADCKQDENFRKIVIADLAAIR